MTASAPATALAPIDPLEVKLDLLRGDIALHLAIIETLEQLAQQYLYIHADEHVIGVVRDLWDRMIAVRALAKKLGAERADAALTAEAAIEFRAAREGRRGASAGGQR